MSTLALSAPVTSIAGGPGAGTILPASETDFGANSGASVPNNGAVLVRVVVGASGAGTIIFNVQRTVEGQSVTPFTVNVANSTTYICGPFRPSDFNDISGLLQVTGTACKTGNSIGVYSLPGIVA